MRRVGPLLAAALILAAGGWGARHSVARAQDTPPARVLILWVPEVTAADLADAPLPAAALALVSTRTSRSSSLDTTLNAVTFGAGARVTGLSSSMLRTGLERAGYDLLGVVRDDRPTNTAAQVFGGPVPMEAARDVEDLLALRRGVAALIDVGGDGARLASAIVRAARPDDLVVVVSAVPGEERSKQGIRLGLAGMRGPGIEPGLLWSPTTRRAGMVALTDLAPTILGNLGMLADQTEGRPAEVRPAIDAAARLTSFEAEIVEAKRARVPVTRLALYAAMALAAFAVAVRREAGRWVAGLHGRGAARSLRSVAAIRGSALPTGGLAVLGLPVAGYLSPLLPGPALAATIVLACATALVGITTAVRRTATMIAAASMTVPVLDLIAGAPLGHRSPWGVLLASGGRFYGGSEEILGLVCGGALVAGALVARSVPSLRAWVIAVAVATAVLAAPGLGAKFGAAPTLVPAFGVFAIRALGRKVTPRAAAAIAAAAVLATAGSVLADRLRPEAERSHVARAIGGETDVGALISRKWEANVSITFGTAWTPAALAAAAALWVLAHRRRLHPGVARALPAVAVASAGSMVFNDGGVVAAATLLVLVLGAAVATSGTPPPPRVQAAG